MGNPDVKLVKVGVSTIAPSDDDSNRVSTISSDSTRVSSSGRIQSWTAAALVLSYFVFSVSLYTVLNQEATKIFWFLFLTIATLVAGTTTLEAYDGLTPLKEARKGTSSFETAGQKFKTNDDALPLVDVVFDLDDSHTHHDLNAIRHVRRNLLYPEYLIRVNVLCREHGHVHALVSDTLDGLGAAGVRLIAVPQHTMASLSGRLAHLLSENGTIAASIVAVFSGDQRPHPHSVRIAVDRLQQDDKIDLVQGRTVRVSQAKGFSIFAALANIEHDMVYALLQPGRAMTWGLNVANDTNSYWRADILRAAASATAGVSRSGHDLGFAAASQGARTVNDLRVICFESCAHSYSGYIHKQALEARDWALAAVRYTLLAFKKHTSRDGAVLGKWRLKSRFGLIYELLVLRIVSHAILQYLCMALALLFTQTPRTTLGFAYLIYFPYPISEWLMATG